LRTIRDARGIDQPLRESAADHPRLAHVRRQLKFGVRHNCLAPLVGMAFATLFLGVLLVIAVKFGGRFGVTIILVTWLVLLVGMFWILERIPFHRSRTWLAHEVMTLKMCACCGYDLRSLPRQPDGCVVCSECGAAWRV
jgi:hypothetical protein